MISADTCVAAAADRLTRYRAALDSLAAHAGIVERPRELFETCEHMTPSCIVTGHSAHFHAKGGECCWKRHAFRDGVCAGWECVTHSGWFKGSSFNPVTARCDLAPIAQDCDSCEPLLDHDPGFDEDYSDDARRGIFA